MADPRCMDGHEQGRGTAAAAAASSGSEGSSSSAPLEDTWPSRDIRTSSSSSETMDKHCKDSAEVDMDEVSTLPAEGSSPNKVDAAETPSLGTKGSEMENASPLREPLDTIKIDAVETSSLPTDGRSDPEGEGTTSEHEAAPLWLETFISSNDKFHAKKEGCSMHKHMQNGKFPSKLALIYYCTTCTEGAICQYGVEDQHSGPGHHVLKTRVVGGNICVLLEDIKAVDETSFDRIQSFVSNGKMVLFLKSKGPTSARSNSKSKCAQCLRSVVFHRGGSSNGNMENERGPRFCSIDCNIQYAHLHAEEEGMTLSLKRGVVQHELADGDKETIVEQIKVSKQAREVKPKSQEKTKKMKDKVDGGGKQRPPRKRKRPVEKDSPDDLGTPNKKRAFDEDEPLWITNVDIPHKIFNVLAPPSMQVEQVLEQVTAAGWKVQQFEASMVEEEIALRESLPDKGEHKKNVFNRMKGSDKPMHVFNVNHDSRTFSVLVPFDELVSNVIYAIAMDFHVMSKLPRHFSDS